MHKKIEVGGKFATNGPKSGPKLVFLSFSDIWFVSFPGNYIG